MSEVGTEKVPGIVTGWMSPGGPRRLALLGASVGAMAAIFAVRLLIEVRAGSGLTFLLAFPIAVLALELGVRAGAAAAVAAIGLVGVWADIRGVDLGVLGYATRAAVYGLTVVLALRQRDRTAAATAELVALAPAGGRATRPRGRNGIPAGAGVPHLTPRELQVLRLVAAGHTNRQVAEQLVLSVRTVEAHRARLQSKLGCSGRAELFRVASAHGLMAEPSTRR